MAQMKPTLSLCIPIYNRLSYLERQLARMIEDKELFEERIQLVISDNCSLDDLQSCCETYQQKGLNLTYHRNENNLGPDGNFNWCFHHADGKYVWLLGSDDIPVRGVLEKILDPLENNDFGLVHLSMKPKNKELTVYSNNGYFLADVTYWITFMSVNIIKTESLKTVNLSDYLSSNMIQVPAYLNACLTADVNAVLYLGRPFEKDSDSTNNGGYNLFHVFVENLFGIYQSFINKGMLSQEAFELIKKVEYRDFLSRYIVDCLILHKSWAKNFDLENSWSILREHYGHYPYAYYYLVGCFFNKIFKSLKIRLFSKNN